MRYNKGSLLLLSVIVSSCGFSNPKDAGSPESAGRASAEHATYAQVNQQILQPRCVSCHNASGRAPDLSSYEGFATNTEYVMPGHAAQSHLYTMVQSGEMPPRGGAISVDQLTLLEAWIQSGAPKN